jgi:hypothetical protein
VTYLLSEKDVEELYDRLNRLTTLSDEVKHLGTVEANHLLAWVYHTRAIMHGWTTILPFPNYSGGLPTEIINSDVVNDCPEHGLFYRTDQKVPVRDCDCPVCEQNEFYPPTRAEREAERQMDAQERRYDERVQEGA